MESKTYSMYLVYAAAILLAFDLLALVFGEDSRPLDVDRATRWFPGHPRTDRLENS